MQVLRAFDCYGTRHFIRAEDHADLRKVRLRTTTRAGAYLAPDPVEGGPMVARVNIVATFPEASRMKPTESDYRTHAAKLAPVPGFVWRVERNHSAAGFEVAAFA